MNKKLVFVSFAILACLIVLPVVRSVNNPAGNHLIATPSLISEGNPMPSPIKPASQASLLVAEGNPMPSPIKPGSHVSVLVAEGNPMPSPIRPASQASLLVAEGNPMPSPLPPGPHFVELTTTIA